MPVCTVRVRVRFNLYISLRSIGRSYLELTREIVSPNYCSAPIAAVYKERHQGVRHAYHSTCFISDKQYLPTISRFNYRNNAKRYNELGRK